MTAKYGGPSSELREVSSKTTAAKPYASHRGAPFPGPSSMVMVQDPVLPQLDATMFRRRWSTFTRAHTGPQKERPFDGQDVQRPHRRSKKVGQDHAARRYQ